MIEWENRDVPPPCTLEARSRGCVCLWRYEPLNECEVHRYAHPRRQPSRSDVHVRPRKGAA